MEWDIRLYRILPENVGQNSVKDTDSFLAPVLLISSGYIGAILILAYSASSLMADCIKR